MADSIETLLDALEDWGAEPKQMIDETFSGDTDFYSTCLMKFSNDDNLELLHSSLIADKKDEAYRAAHTIKGNADYLGLFPILDAAMVILTDLRASQIERAASNVPRLDNAFAQLRQILTTTGQR